MELVPNFICIFVQLKNMFKSKGDNCWHCSRPPLYVPVDICCSFVIQVKDTLVSDLFNFRIMSDRRLHVFFLCYMSWFESCSISSFCCWKFIILICFFYIYDPEQLIIIKTKQLFFTSIFFFFCCRSNDF